MLLVYTVTLAEAIDRWRTERDVVLAERIDDLSQAVAPLSLPAQRAHRWWMEHAKTYDPVVVTTLLAHLRAHANDEQLADRIRAMLAWPDDPRVAVALAESLVKPPFLGLQRLMRRRSLANPFVDEVVKRITEIGDARALERVASLWSLLGEAARDRITSAQIREPRHERPTVPIVETAWQAVIAEPFSTQARLVLADAYLQAGDPRGEVIATQCAPLVAIEAARARGEKLDASGLFGVRAEQTQKQIDASWYRWLGEVALVVSRDSKFRGGLLADVEIGHAAMPSGSWVLDRVAGHRELCALERVRPSSWIRAVRYVRFLSTLSPMPRWIHVDDHVAAKLRDSRIAARGVVVDWPAHGMPVAPLAKVVDNVLEAVPTVERLDLGWISGWSLDDARAIASRVKVPLRFRVDWQPTDEQRAILDEMRTWPHVTIIRFGDA